MKIQRPIGTYDLTPEDTILWQWLEERIRILFRTYNYGEIRTPIFEYTDLFQRGVGESSDIVSKEMYTFIDRGERSLTLRPEGTASVVRAYMENGLDKKTPGVTKLWYFAPMFRYERKQKGRYRQHVQYGCEVLGSKEPAVDVEILEMIHHFYQSLGLHELELLINSVGCPECRPGHRDKFIAYVQPNLDSYCQDCHHRFEVNPLRMMDCKNETCQEMLTDAPSLLDMLCDECKTHFATVRKGLDKFSIQYKVQPNLVRGLDYYTRTAFEMIYAPLGSQGVLMGGGRYDGLVEYLGGPSTPGIGFGAGMERLLLIMKETGKVPKPEDGLDLFVVPIGESAELECAKLMQKLRSQGFCCDRDYTGKSIRKQMQMANKVGARFSTVVGDDEITQKSITIKNMDNGEEKQLTWDDTLHDIQAFISNQDK